MKHIALAGLALFALAGGWEIRPTGTRASFRGLSVVNATTAWVSGSRATFLRTTDGGATWKLD